MGFAENTSVMNILLRNGRVNPYATTELAQHYSTELVSILTTPFSKVGSLESIKRVFDDILLITSFVANNKKIIDAKNLYKQLYWQLRYLGLTHHHCVFVFKSIDPDVETENPNQKLQQCYQHLKAHSCRVFSKHISFFESGQQLTRAKSESSMPNRKIDGIEKPKLRKIASTNNINHYHPHSLMILLAYISKYIQRLKRIIDKGLPNTPPRSLR